MSKPEDFQKLRPSKIAERIMTRELDLLEMPAFMRLALDKALDLIPEIDDYNNPPRVPMTKFFSDVLPYLKEECRRMYNYHENEKQELRRKGKDTFGAIQSWAIMSKFLDPYKDIGTAIEKVQNKEPLEEWDHKALADAPRLIEDVIIEIEKENADFEKKQSQEPKKGVKEPLPEKTSQDIPNYTFEDPSIDFLKQLLADIKELNNARGRGDVEKH